MLGGLKNALVSAGSTLIDANEIKEFCIIRTSVARDASVWLNLPSDIDTDWGYLITIPSAENKLFRIQLFFNGAEKTYKRTFWGGWYDWYKVTTTKVL